RSAGPSSRGGEMTEASTEQEVVGYQVENGVAWITLNRPESLNAGNTALRGALAAAVRRGERDESARAVVGAGRGRAFCAGGDVREFGGRVEGFGNVRGEYEFLLGHLHAMAKPTIAALNGVAAGIGASLALACDIRYAVPQASFVEAFVKIGLTVD